LESLALRYRQTIEELEHLTGEKITVLHLVGGGSQNKFLNQFTAEAIQRSVIAGPVEATAIGNLLGQAIAVGEIKDLAEARQVVRLSASTETYAPQHPGDWEKAYGRFQKLVNAR